MQVINNTEPITESIKNTFETYDHYTNSRLSFKKPDQKIIPNEDKNAQSQFYYQIPLIYNYGTDKNKNYSSFYLEACEFTATRGIVTKPSPNGRSESSIMVVFDKSDSNLEYIKCMDSIHDGCAKILFENRGIVKLPHFKANDAEATGLKKLIFRKRDELTSEIIEDRNPSTFLKLFTYEKDGKKNQTTFTGVNGKIIPWSTLTNAEFKFIPLLQFRCIYIGGGKASIQTSVVSAIVTSISPKSNITKQISTLEKLRKENPYLQDIFSNQLDKMLEDKEDTQEESPEQNETQTQTQTQTQKNESLDDSESKIQEIIKKIPNRTKIPVIGSE